MFKVKMKGGTETEICIRVYIEIELQFLNCLE